MEHISTLLFSIISLLIIANFTFYFSKKINFPYTLLLVAMGMLLIPISNLPHLKFLREFELSKDILFFVFLPVLLFEAAYNIHYRGLLKNIKAISLTAIIGLLISTLIIGFGLFYTLPFFGINIPIAVTMLFGAIISATDPVAVVALFKEYGAPKRLGLLFEGESLFNDGTAVALFVVILGVIENHAGVFSIPIMLEGFEIFLSLIVFGVIFGIISGYIFSKAMGLIKDENIQITFSLLSAHLTFLTAEVITEDVKIGDFDIHISGIIATVISALIIGNFGRYKLSPKSEFYTDKFWHYFAFVSNSFVFILLGLGFYKIDFSSINELIIPIVLAIVITIFARAISIYSVLKPLNYFKLEEKIPNEWMILLSWGSLRGALAIIMVLMIPEGLEIANWPFELSIRDFIFVLVSASVVFTLFVKGLTISKLIKKMKLDKLEKLEEFEYFLGKVDTYTETLKYIENAFKEGRLSKKEYQFYLKDFSEKIKKQKNKINEILKDHPEYLKKALKYFALGIERDVLKDTYQKNLISENGYKKYKDNILLQKESLQENKENYSNIIFEIGENISKKLSFVNKMSNKEKYLYYRALSISSKKVSEEISKIKNTGYINDFDNDFSEIINEYEQYFIKSNEKKRILVGDNETMKEYRRYILDHEILEKEDEILENISNNDFITSKLGNILKMEFKNHKDDKKENF